jgi:hypothetical protein
MTTLDDFFGDGSADNTPECSFCGGQDGELIVSVSDHYGPTHWHHEVCKAQDDASKDQILTPQGTFKNIHTPDDFSLADLVACLVKTDAVKDYTALEDWIEAGDTGGMTPQQIADEWDALPTME